MGYRRTIRCSHCYKSGHNIRSCPKLKEDAAGGSYYAERKLERVRARRVTTRRCSYCKEAGHNVRGCSLKTGDKMIYEDMVATVSTWFENLMKEAAFGVGSIITCNPYVSSRSEDFNCIVLAKNDKGTKFDTELLCRYLNTIAATPDQPSQLENTWLYGYYPSLHEDKYPIDEDKFLSISRYCNYHEDSNKRELPRTLPTFKVKSFDGLPVRSDWAYKDRDTTTLNIKDIVLYLLSAKADVILDKDSRQYKNYFRIVNHS